MKLDIKTADHVLRDKTPIVYKGNKYAVKEMVIWYDIYNHRQCSFILTDEKNRIVRARITECEVLEDGR